jgi:hypothetical protein
MSRTKLSERRKTHQCNSIFTLFFLFVLSGVGWTLLFGASPLADAAAAQNTTQFACVDKLVAFNKVFRMDDGSEVADCRSVAIQNILVTIREKWQVSTTANLRDKDDSIILEILFLAVLGHDFENIDYSSEHTTIVVDSTTGLLRRNNSMDRHRMVALEFMVIIALLTLGYVWIQDMQRTTDAAEQQKKQSQQAP